MTCHSFIYSIKVWIVKGAQICNFKFMVLLLLTMSIEKITKSHIFIDFLRLYLKDHLSYLKNEPSECEQVSCHHIDLPYSVVTKVKIAVKWKNFKQ